MSAVAAAARQQRISSCCCYYNRYGIVVGVVLSLLVLFPCIISSTDSTDQTNQTNCTYYDDGDDLPVIIIGAGISGLATAKTLRDKGCRVIVLEARNYTGGRAHTEQRDGWIFFHGANWVHGQKGNPIWELNEREHLFETQWLPRTYLSRMSDGTSVRAVGNATYVPGGALRDDFSDFQLSHDRFGAWAEAVRRGSYDEPDLPYTYFAEEYVRARNLTRESDPTGHSLEEFELFNDVWCTLDQAVDLFATGMASSVARVYDRDLENMVGKPGYQALSDYLARDIVKNKDIRLNTPVRHVAYDAGGVSVTTRAGAVVRGSRVVVTVSNGVLGHGDIDFSPRLPPWKYRCWRELRLGVLEKVYLRWEHAWWPADSDAFWRVRSGEGVGGGKTTANEWYNVHNMPGVTAPVLLTTPAGTMAKLLETWDDARVTAWLMDELRTIFPEINVPDPVELVRTHWWLDEFSRGSYVDPLVDVDPVCAEYLGEPVSGRVFFAGEGTSTLRFGYVDGAYETGLDAASRVQASLVPNATAGAFTPPEQGYRPHNDAQIRQRWFAKYKSVLVQARERNK